MRYLFASIALHTAVIATIVVICRGKTNAPDEIEVIDLDMEVTPIEFMELGANEQSVEEYAEAPSEVTPIEPPNERPLIEPEAIVDEPETTDEAEVAAVKVKSATKPTETTRPTETVKPIEKAKPTEATGTRQEQAKIVSATCNRDSIRPRYPKRSRQRGEQGEVKMEVAVAADGTVTAVRVTVSSGFPRLDDAAIEAVRKADFTAAREGDQAIPSTIKMSLNFKLD